MTTIKSVVILGGGSSGWCSAAALSKFCPELDITVIESDTIPTIGVGESTIQYFNHFIKLLGLRDQDWMPKCAATYKNAIRFSNFKPDHYYYAPFYEMPVNNTDFHNRLHEWSTLATYDSSLTGTEFARYIWPGSYLLDANRICLQDSTLDFSIAANTSYNLDAGLFGRYLRDQYCRPRGVKAVLDTIVGIHHKGYPQIGYLIGESGAFYKADLFIDCTGFRAYLLNAVGAQFQPYRELFNNRAVVYNNIQYQDPNQEMLGYVDTNAQPYGWIWRIPLWNRISMGHVYSTNFSTDDEAKLALDKFVGAKRVQGHEPMFVDMQNGRQDRAWIGNVVGIGLSSGFIEPLGSTGLLLTQRGIIRLATMLVANNYQVSRFDTDLFNRAYRDLIDSFKDFYLIHFATTTRTDTEYWRYIHDKLSPDSESYQLATQPLLNTISETPYNSLLNQWHWQLYGMGKRGVSIDLLNSVRHNPATRKNCLKNYHDFLQRDRDLKKYVTKLPTLYEYQRENIYLDRG